MRDRVYFTSILETISRIDDGFFFVIPTAVT